MFSLSTFLWSVPLLQEKTWKVSISDAQAFFQTMYLYDSALITWESREDKERLRNKIETISESDFWLFTKENRDEVKKYIEKYAHNPSLLRQIDAIERERQKLYTYFENLHNQFKTIPVDLIEEKMRLKHSEWPFDDVKYYLIQWHCLESQFFRESIDPPDPLHNKNTYKHLEFQVRLLMQELGWMIVDITEKQLHEQVERFLDVLWNWRFDSQRPHEDAFSELQNQMAHVTKQWLLFSLQ